MILLAVLLAALTAAFLGPAPKAQAYPQPAMIVRAWEFEFSYDKPRLASFKDHEGKVSWYWFMTYKVVNNTNQERMFIPDVEVGTDAGEVIEAGRNVPASIFLNIKKQIRNPFLESPVHVVGRILLGEEHAKESVIVWPVGGKDVDEMRIFVAGLSGETQVVKNSTTGDNVVLRKTLMINVKLPGNPQSIREQNVEMKGQSWIMR